MHVMVIQNIGKDDGAMINTISNIWKHGFHLPVYKKCTQKPELAPLPLSSLSSFKFWDDKFKNYTYDYSKSNYWTPKQQLLFMYCKKFRSTTGWWLKHLRRHLKKICTSNWIIFAGRGENETYLKPSPKTIFKLSNSSTDDWKESCLGHLPSFKVFVGGRFSTFGRWDLILDYSGWIHWLLICRYASNNHVSNEKKRTTFHYTSCLIGILIMVYYNPYKIPI